MASTTTGKIILKSQEDQKYQALLEDIYKLCLHILNDNHEVLKKRLMRKCKTYYQHTDYANLKLETKFAIACEVKSELQKENKKSLKIPRKYSSQKAEILKACKIHWDISNHQKAWTDEDLKYVFENVTDFFSLKEAAEKLKRTLWAVTLVIYAIYQEEYKRYTKYFEDQQRERYYNLAVESASQKLTQIADLYVEFTEILTACG